MGSGVVAGVDEAVLQEAVRRLREVYRPWRIYLFGSRARGDARPDSDYDFLIVVPDDAERARLDGRLGYTSMRGVSLAEDLVVWTREAFESRVSFPASLPGTVVREGRLLYAGS